MSIKYAWVASIAITLSAFGFVAHFLSAAFSIESIGLVFSMFGVELALFLIFSSCFILLVDYSRRKVSDVRYGFSNSKFKEKLIFLVLVLVSIGVVSSSALVGAYNGRKLVLGNLIEFRQADQTFLSDAHTSFRVENDSRKTIDILDRCANILNSEECVYIRDSLKSRVTFLRDASVFAKNNIPGLKEKIFVYELIANYSGETQQLKVFREQLEKIHGEASVKYRESVILVDNGEYVKAIEELKGLDQVWPGFGHNSFLRDEIAKILKEPGPDSRQIAVQRPHSYPYLNALFNIGVDDYVEQAIKTSSIRAFNFIYGLSPN